MIYSLSCIIYSTFLKFYNFYCIFNNFIFDNFYDINY